VHQRTGHVYVADSFNDRVVEFDPSGAFVRSWGRTGSAPGELLVPWGIAVDSSSDRIYVSDSGNHRVQIFNLTGGLLSTFGSYGTGAGQVSWRQAGAKLGATE